MIAKECRVGTITIKTSIEYINDHRVNSNKEKCMYYEEEK